LEDQLDNRGGAEVGEGSIQMTRFSIERMTRRVPKNENGDRKPDTIKRPDVTLVGRLTVTDSDAFLNLLRSGIGRHKSFGYGMLKVRR
jgi:CRISPR system Cascade subunit CasE